MALHLATRFRAFIARWQATVTAAANSRTVPIQFQNTGVALSIGNFPSAAGSRAVGHHSVRTSAGSTQSTGMRFEVQTR